MFTKVRLKNFRSFDDIEFDLTEKNDSPKNLAIIYGENGAGKSNLMSAFVLLNELLQTMNLRDAYEELLSQKTIFNDEKYEQVLRQKILDEIRDMKAIIDDCRLTGSEDPILAEYEFQIGDHKGKYTVELGSDEIIHERLEYLLNKRRGIYFECSESGIMINKTVVKKSDLLSDIKDSAKRFWGKHSLLAIIAYELNDKSNSYGRENISENFNDVLSEMIMLSCYVKIGSRYWSQLFAPLQVLSNPIHGSISLDKESQLDLAETVFTSFFSAINSDILKVFYKKRITEKRINYELFFEKIVAGLPRDISFSRESTGNHQLIQLLCYLLTACMGGTIVIDEADSGIHDVLCKKILQEISPYISGQIIMTTHNSLLMESTFSHSATYFISENNQGQTVIRSVADYEKRTFLNNNIRNKYINNEYGGLPIVKEIAFSKLIELISEALN